MNIFGRIGHQVIEFQEGNKRISSKSIKNSLVC